MAQERACIHSNAIICNEARCSVKCVWNPRGAAERKKLIRTKGLTEKADGTRCLVLKKGAAQ